VAVGRKYLRDSRTHHASADYRDGFHVISLRPSESQGLGGLSGESVYSA
jgi:hypothetical protein